MPRSGDVRTTEVDGQRARSDLASPAARPHPRRAQAGVVTPDDPDRTAVVAGEQTSGTRGACTVSLSEISTGYGEDPVLHRLSLELPPGRVTVLMGPSGCGKTTLVRHLVGLLPPGRGRVLIDGQDLADLLPAELNRLRRDFGVLLGGSTLFDSSIFRSQTVWENVAFPLRQLRLGETEVGRRSWAQLERFDLIDVAASRPDELAARTRRRVALAAALVGDPRLVVLDDPDTGMDGVHEDRIAGEILAAHRRTGATFLVTTHSVTTARRIGQHLAILVNGRIVTAGDPAELLDGVDSGEEFDRRFRIMDHLGPPKPAMVTDRAERTFVYDPLVLAFFLVIAALLAWILLVGDPAPSPF
jgi:ABC-type transporter Mla maintaining outer membrane lipid asymmetry ATPase subunit MlaF